MIDPSAFRQILSGRRLQLAPVQSSMAQPLWEAIESSRSELKRRFNWAGSAALDDAKRFVEDAAKEAERGSEYTAAIFESRSRRLVGVAALKNISAGDYAKAKLMLWIRSDRLGRGYATEAGKLLEEHAFKGMNLHRLYARIDPANRAGRKTIQKIGFRYEGCLREDKKLNGRWIHQECWGLLRTEWKK